MSSRTKIVVLHMKEIIYTAIFAALAILLIILPVIMFKTDNKETDIKNKDQTTFSICSSFNVSYNTDSKAAVH